VERAVVVRPRAVTHPAPDYYRSCVRVHPWVQAKIGPRADALGAAPADDRRMTDHEAVTVRGLRKSYGDRLVVDDVSLDVAPGEVVGLIGANGAGKTTTVECVQGLRRPDAGTVRVLGLDPVRQADRLRQSMGSQLQDSALPDRLRVGEAIELFATGRARPAGDLLAQFGLLERRRCAFASLSGGERQRLFLVLALLNRPRLVILDELTQGLDPAARREVWAAVGQLRAAGTTVLLVTHELDEAEALCDRVVAMRAGRVLDSGPPAELVARHAPWAKIEFGWPEDGAAGAAGAAELVASLRALPGAREVSAAAGQLRVLGDRRLIAHVGAELVRRDRIPPDLRVTVADLESALLALLEGDAALPAATVLPAVTALPSVTARPGATAAAPTAPTLIGTS
jgi:ABC-2 type transport system ATP-binding protein